MLEDIKHRLDGMETGASRTTRTGHRQEQQEKKPAKRDVRGEYTDNEEDQGLSTRT